MSSSDSDNEVVCDTEEVDKEMEMDTEELATSNPPAESDESGEESDNSDDSEDSDPKPSESTFSPVEPTDDEWKAHGWSSKLPLHPKCAQVEELIGTFKKTHKNSLPNPSQLCDLLEFKLEEHVQDKVYRVILGVKNAEGKLDQKGQHGSMRSFYKEQFPKSERAKGPGVSFSVIENEEMLPVEQAYVPMLQKAVANMVKRASNCDRGHEPKAKLAAWTQRLEKAEAALKKRRICMQELENQKKRRKATQQKARSKSSERFKTEVKQQVDEVKKNMKQRIDELVAGGMEYSAAVDKELSFVSVPDAGGKGTPASPASSS